MAGGAPTYLERLLGEGLLSGTGVPGLYGRSAAFEDVVEALEGWITREGAADRPERVRFPPVTPRAVLERSGYVRNFPHLAATVHCFCGDERSHRDLVRRLDAGEDWTGAQEASDVALTPAACHPVYPLAAARGPLGPDGARFDVMSWCFRREPSDEPTRMQAFRMREHVRIGSPEQVEAFRDTWVGRVRRMGEALRLPHEIDVAHDPFFGRVGRLQADNQASARLKFEFLVPVNDGAGPTACVSFNHHLDHFAKTWGIEAHDGAVVHSGCVGFGLERLALALLRHHGPDVERWPEEVRAELRA